MKSVLVAKVVIVDPAGNVLLLRRSQTDPRRPGDWDFPGGGVESDESFRLAVAREAFEEAGVKADPKQFVLLYTGTEYYEPKNENVHRCLFLLKTPGDVEVMLSDEHDAAKWVTPEQALVDFPHPFYGTGLRYALDHGLLN